jgi:hypothetical protein
VLILFHDHPATMAPNQSNTLIYENEDVEKVKTYEKKGELLSRESYSSTDNVPCQKVPLAGGKLNNMGVLYYSYRS